MAPLIVLVWLACSMLCSGAIVAVARGSARLRAMNRSGERRRAPDRRIAGDMRGRP